ncbi:hypothetical protein [Leifsonia sp. 1010]|uniref:hypothetical protein n=1 Tax=Leifsonia sp. 1010 TaxID=2817769 RepID=UPI00285A2845|nr:hypothetical protein [Leifsonia sp. 1010]MDR6610689.1 uncharacterized protein YceK [Leifsonia sp. 1010]
MKHGRGVVARVAVIAALIAALSGCSSIGDALKQKTTPAENIGYQRMLAKKFKVNWPAVEIIEYTREGSIDGSGEWSTNAVVTIAGKTYQEIFGVSVVGGDPLPDPDASPATESVTVRYSDGTSEVMK